MFFKATLTKDLLLEPKDMGKHVKQKMSELLKEAVEGKLMGNHGFVIAVLQVESIGSGKVDNSMGSAMYRIQYTALVFRPFAQEVCDCIVTNCSAYGISCTMAGMLDVFVHRNQMPPDVQTFSDGAWVSEDGQVSIRAGYGLRLRIISTRFETSMIYGVGTIYDHYCGMLFSDEIKDVPASSSFVGDEEVVVEEEEPQNEAPVSTGKRKAEEEEHDVKRLRVQQQERSVDANGEPMSKMGHYDVDEEVTWVNGGDNPPARDDGE